MFVLRKRKKTTANCTAKFCLTKLRDDNFPGMADDPASLENCRFHPRNPQFCCAIGGVIFLFCISKFCIRIAVCLHLNSSPDIRNDQQPSHFDVKHFRLLIQRCVASHRTQKCSSLLSMTTAAAPVLPHSRTCTWYVLYVYDLSMLT